MSKLRRAKCSNHREREAVARCLVCGSDFCRECVTEHDGRMICAQCLSLQKKEAESRVGIVELLLLGVGFGVSFLIVWSFFNRLGSFLVSLPHEFH